MIRQAGLFLYHYLRAKKQSRFQTREELERWQHQKVVSLLQRILPNSPYYQHRYTGLSLEQWRSFPIIEKADMMEHFDQLNTVGITKEQAFQVAYAAETSRDFSSKVKGVTVGLSSGTSGNRGIFLVSDEEKAAWAGSILGKTLPGTLLSKQRIAFFLRANSNLYTTVNKGRIRFTFFDLMKDVRDHVPRLQAFQPTIIVAPPSMLRYLAEEIGKGLLSIQPQKIISVAEVLDPLDKAFIERTCKQVVHQIYQCTEGFLATTCRYGTLHLNEDLVVIDKEYLDREQGKFSPIVTDFSRTTQPILRYRLNDILVEKKTPCPCGSIHTAIEDIEGRCDDLFYFPAMDAPDTLVMVFPDFIRRAIIAAAEENQQYLVIQHRLDQIEIALDQRKATEERVRASIETMCRALGVHCPHIHFSDYSRSPSDKKLRRVERRVLIDQHQVVSPAKH